MRRFCVLLGLGASAAVLAGCTAPTAEPAQAQSSSPVAASRTIEKTAPTAAQLEQASVAYFAGGCFWGVEHFLEQMDGVLDVDSGYMGGAVDSPTYQQVSYEETGHLEAVRVRYDPSKVDYRALAKRFFEIHDPTQADGQGPDRGSQYLSAIFVDSAAEKKIVQGLIGQLEARGYEVATQVRDGAEFWPAEDYHQDYYVKTGKQPYCHRPVDRFGDAGD